MGVEELEVGGMKGTIVPAALSQGPGTAHNP